MNMYGISMFMHSEEDGKSNLEEIRGQLNWPKIGRNKDKYFGFYV